MSKVGPAVKVAADLFPVLPKLTSDCIKCHFHRFAWQHSQLTLIQEIHKKADFWQRIEIIRAQTLKLCTLMIRSDVAVAFRANLHNSIPADRPTRRTSVHLRACHELSVLEKFN